MTLEPELPPRLEHFGKQLVAVAHARHTPPVRRRWRVRTLIATPVVVAAAVVGVLIATTAGTTTSKAYALTQNENGSYTLTINDISTAVVQLNAAFASLGISAKAIPVTADCTPQAGTFIPPLMAPVSSTSGNESITLSNANVPPGWTTYIAAEQTPSGIRLSVGSTAAPLPSCLITNESAPVVDPTTTPTSTTTGG